MTMLLLLAMMTATPADDLRRVDALVRAGDLDGAERALNEVELPRDVEARLLGLVRLKQRRFKAAAALFSPLVAADPEDLALRVSLAAALIEDARARGALEHLQKAAKLDAPIVPLLRARAHRALGDDDAASAALQDRRFRTRPEFVLARVDLLSVSGRELAALEEAESLLGTEAAKRAADRVASSPRSLPFLEAVAATGDLEDRERLGRAYAQHGQSDVAAEVLLDVEVHAPGRVSALVADLLARTGRTDEALRMNARTGDLSQRLQILFSAERYSAVAALGPRLKEPDAAARYRLAYANYRVGALMTATRWAQSLEGTAFEDAARALLGALR